MRGEGDGERNKIFADAYGADPDFFAFYRSMQAYEIALPSSRAVIGPTSDFFRFFRSPTPPPARRPAAPAPAPVATRRSEIGRLMQDFGSALGLMFAIEGLAMAAFTEPMRKRMAEAARLEAPRLRWMGVFAAALGVAVVWAVRTHSV